jgi:hypothetical protein
VNRSLKTREVRKAGSDVSGAGEENESHQEASGNLTLFFLVWVDSGGLNAHGDDLLSGFRVFELYDTNQEKVNTFEVNNCL